MVTTVAELGTRVQTLRMAATVLIVDDHPGFRAAARRLLELEGYVVVGEAEDGLTGIDAARRLRPDFVLLDVQLPDIDGFEVAERMSDEAVTPAVVLTSSREASDYGPCLARTPAAGFLPKAELSGAGIADILPA
jgi:DNA-binding NarL/FixJ family response regulator